LVNLLFAQVSHATVWSTANVPSAHATHAAPCTLRLASHSQFTSAVVLAGADECE